MRRPGADDRKRKGLDMADADAMIDGFCGISQRRGLKPIIAAVNGYAFGMNRHRILNFLPNFPFPRLGSEMMSFLITRFISRETINCYRRWNGNGR